jgi:hypothetical protein
VNETVDFTFRIGVVTVGDYVWADLNNNGLQDGGEPGVASITVRLYDAATDTEVTQDAEGNPLPAEVTDVNGEYLFEDIPAGDYYVIFDLGTVPGIYAPTTQDVGGNAFDNIDSDADPLTGQTASTGFIAGGGEDLSLDMGLVCIAEVEAGKAVTICATGEVMLSSVGASVTPTSQETSTLWATSGDGIFLDIGGNELSGAAAAFTDVVSYRPGAQDVSNGSVTLTLTLDTGSPCGFVTDQLIINVLKVDCGAFPWDGN